MTIDWREIPGRYIRDPRLGHRLGRNYPAGELTDPVWDLYWLGTDQDGLVYNQKPIREYELGDKNHFRVFLFGGSTLMGLGVKNNSETISSELERELQRELPHARAVNCGVGAYSSWQEMTYLSLELIRYKPDVVVLLDGWNDFVHSSWGNKGYHGKWIPNTHRSLDDIVVSLQQSTGDISFKDFIKRKIEKLEIVREYRKRSAFAIQAGAWSDPDYRVWSLKPESIIHYINNHLNVIGMCQAHGSKVISLLQPQIIWGNRKLTEHEQQMVEKVTPRMPPIPKLGPEWFRLAQASFIEMKNNFCGSASVIIEDASSWLDEPTEPLYHDYNHYNALGQKLIGKKISDLILKFELKKTASIGALQ